MGEREGYGIEKLEDEYHHENNYRHILIKENKEFYFVKYEGGVCIHKTKISEG